MGVGTTNLISGGSGAFGLTRNRNWDSRERRQRRPSRARRQLTIRRKGNEIRTISLSTGAWEILSSIPAHLTGKWLFWHGNGEQYQNVSARFHELVTSAQKSAQKEERQFRPFTFHHLRHYYAVEYLKNGGNIYTLQKHLNHKRHHDDRTLSRLPDAGGGAQGQARVGTNTGTAIAV
jgi:integrase